MDLDDIVLEIALNIEDVNTLSDFCYINHNQIYICSKEQFWRRLFEEWGFRIPDELPTNLNDWLNEFKAQYNIREIEYQLSQNSTYTFNYIKEDLNYFETLLNLIGIDIENIRRFKYIASIHQQSNISIISNIKVKYFKGKMEPYQIIFGMVKDSPTVTYTPNMSFVCNYQQFLLFLYNSFYDHAIIL